LTIPIYVNRASMPINGQPAPWLQEDEAGVGHTARYMAWGEGRRGVRPLTVISLGDITLGGGRKIPPDGVLSVPPPSIISIQEFGDVTVYVRHMLITERERDLLPEWARFVAGVIDCPLLNPTASRESLRHDEIYSAVQAALARQLLAHFEQLAESAP